MDRSHMEKRSAYAPEQGAKYDGIYRIEKCWRKPGIQVCLYLFVRCDNDPAPWTRPLRVIKELKDASDVIERKGSPSWDYDVRLCNLRFFCTFYVC
ncbi:putative PUA-like superfamily, SRA-YDG superfamily protein [Helianthus anomalus]